MIHRMGGLPMTAGKAKVCIFFPTIEAGGMERALIGIATSLMDLGYEIVLFYSSCQERTMAMLPQGLRLVRAESSRSHRGMNRKVWEALSLLPKWTAFLRREKPGCVLSFQSTAVAVPIARAVGVPIIHRESSDCRAALGSQGRSLSRAAVRLGKRTVYRFCDAIVANSSSSAESLSALTGISREKIGLIYNPVDLRSLSLRAEELPEPDAWFPGHMPVVISVGRLSREKNFPALIRAFRIVRDACECGLVIIGEGGERPALQALIEELDLERSVKLPGYRANPHAYMSKAAVFALSSHFEGLPNAMLEAVALGVPVVSVDCPSGPREILSDGRGGILVTAGDDRALGEAILGLIRDSSKAKELAQRASQDAYRFDPARIGRQYGDLIDKVCRGGR